MQVVAELAHDPQAAPADDGNYVSLRPLQVGNYVSADTYHD